MMRYVILDRDGVINADSDTYIKSVEEWQPLPGALEGIARLTAGGFAVTVATNQSGIARGLFNVDGLSSIHQALRLRVAALGGRIEMIAFCPHGPDEDCGCRKPKGGLLREIAQRMGSPLTGVPVIGDSLRDLQAALAVGARPILVRTGNGSATAEGLTGDWAGTPIVDDLGAAADLVLAG